VIVAMYLGAIVVANLLAATYGPAITVPSAFLLIGLDLTARDRLHDRWEHHGLRWRMAALIGAGGLLSWVLNSGAGPIALGSTVAFVASATVDALVYQALAHRGHGVRVNGSNVASAAADSVLFPLLAFGAVLPWVVLGQFVAKVAGGALWHVALIWRARRAVSLRPRAA
jgi:hypothetical protein